MIQRLRSMGTVLGRQAASALEAVQKRVDCLEDELWRVKAARNGFEQDAVRLRTRVEELLLEQERLAAECESLRLSVPLTEL